MTESTNAIICPRCGHKHTNIIDYLSRSPPAHYKCDRCDERFTAWHETELVFHTKEGYL